MKSKLNKQQKKYIKACDGKELRKVFTKFFKNQNKILKEAKKTPIVFKDGSFTTNNPFLSEFLDNHPMFSTKTHISNYLTKEDLESLTNPDLIDKRKEFHNAIDEHIEKGKDELDFLFKKEKHTEPLEFDLPKKDIGTHTVELKEDSIIFKEIDDSIVEFIGKNTNVIFKRIGDYYGMSIDLDSMTKEQHKEFFKICNNHREKYGIVSETPKSKTFSKEDMFKCFYESRLTTNPLTAVFKFVSFASYIESLQK